MASSVALVVWLVTAGSAAQAPTLTDDAVFTIMKNYVQAKACSEKGNSFTSEEVRTLHSAIATLFEKMSVTRASRDEAWRILNMPGRGQDPVHVGACANLREDISRRMPFVLPDIKPAAPNPF